MLIGDAY